MPSSIHQWLLLWIARKMIADGYAIGGYDGVSPQGGPLNKLGYVRLGRFEKALGHLLSKNGVSWRRATALAAYPSQSALMLLAYMCLGMRQRYQTPKSESEDNLACDIEAVQIALYGRGLVSADRLAVEIHDDLRLIAREVWA